MLRVVHVLVQPVLVYDDGDELSPGPAVQANQVPLSALAGLADQIRAEVARLNDPPAAEDQPSGV